MKNVLKDDKLRKLLKDKHRLEMFSWIIPIVSIVSLLIVLYLLAMERTTYTIAALIVLIIIIIAGYVFDTRVTYMIHHAYAKLNDYFQDKIVPQLLLVDNPSIVYNEEIRIPRELIDQVKVFNNYKEYNSYFHYTGKLENLPFTFDEIVFESLVDYDTTEQKELNTRIKNDINYHWYTIDLEKEYPGEALFTVGEFSNYEGQLIRNYQKFDFENSRLLLNKDNDLQLFLSDINNYKQFTSLPVMKALNNEYIVYNMKLVLYINRNKLNIIIEEVKDLINLSHSNKIVVENLLAGYYEEQKAIKLLIKAFNK